MFKTKSISRNSNKKSIIHLTFSEKKDLELARKELKKGQYVTLAEIEYELGITS